MKKKNLLEIKNLKKHFPVKKGIFGTLFSRDQQWIKAVDDVSFNLIQGNVLGLAGESGCGKTTVGRTILNLLKPTNGEVIFNDIDIFKLSNSEMKSLRRKIQIIYQDPYESLNPRMKVCDIIGEGIDIHKLTSLSEERKKMIEEGLEMVELVPVDEFYNRFPHELSGGQRQRVCIARTLVLKPEFIIADEPVSMLDASIRASILQLMMKLKNELDITYLFITHDLAMARQICDQIAIMYLGKIVEVGEIDIILQTPQHPYTKALIAASPDPDPTTEKREVLIKGDIPKGSDPPSGCRFHPRCLYAKNICKQKEPKLIEFEVGHLVACHFPDL